MDDLISRQDAIDALVGMDGKRDDDGYVMIYRCDACDNIYNLPSAQPEIIRCKDCLMHGVCRFEQGLGLDGYCSQAERRTDG